VVEASLGPLPGEVGRVLPLASHLAIITPQSSGLEFLFLRCKSPNLTQEIIGAAIDVHKTLGPGFIESIYENALTIELRKHTLKVQQQLEIPVKYDGFEVGKHRLDLLVEDIIVVELKAIKSLDDIHYAIVRSYLRSTGQKHGLLLNFAKTTLEIRRLIASE
jgi:GxxExxY protein